MVKIWLVTHDHKPTVNRALAVQNKVLSNPPKSPSQIPMLNNVVVASGTDFSDNLNQFKDELSKSIEESLGVQIKPSKTTYCKSYPSRFDFMKAPDGWRVVVTIVDHLWSLLACFLHK